MLTFFKSASLPSSVLKPTHIHTCMFYWEHFMELFEALNGLISGLKAGLLVSLSHISWDVRAKLSNIKTRMPLHASQSLLV